jgi:predicted MFS family arabinose efflux permease
MSKPLPAAISQPQESPHESREVRHLRDLSPQQWKSGIAAWLGWFFDGLDMHLYTLVAAPFVMELVGASSVTDALVREKSSWIQAGFLVGWALGGGFFGRMGDIIGRSRALSLTILTYSVFTGLSYFAHTWQELMVYRFVAALGIGGEWAVGSSLLSETWPRRWRPHIAAVLQAGVNFGILGACLAAYLMAALPPRNVFLVGILPALIVYWIRRHVPEPEEWLRARGDVGAVKPGIADLFRGDVRATTMKTVGLCALSLTAWWAFMFWQAQHLRNLPELAPLARADRERLVSEAFFLLIAVQIAGNFALGFFARWLGYRRAIAALTMGLALAMFGSFAVERDYASLAYFWFPLVGFFGAVYGLYTMYLPPLFPTLLRTTGAGFSYNIGRIFAAIGTVFFGLFANVGDFRITLLCAAALLVPATILALMAPDLPLD